MKKLTVATLGVIASLAALSPSAFADTKNTSGTTFQKLSEESGALAQVTSVSQLSDVQPTDWAFTALQSLVERYGCIAGYPNGTFRGNRATSRFEFAAGLNACLDKINELISSGLADKVGKEDLATLQKLQTEFAAELTALKGRVDALEAKTATLEAQQFSTVTKLNAEVIALGVAATKIRNNGATDNVTLGSRVRLNFDTSFTGSDSLNIRMAAQNVTETGAGQFGVGSADTNETRLLPSFANGNTFALDNLIYSFPVGEKLRVYVGTVITDVTFIGVDAVTPLGSYATGAISNFANSNPALYTQVTGAGGSLSYKFNDNFVATAGYVAEGAAPGPAFPGPNGGLTGGGRTIFGNLNAYLGSAAFGLYYANTFSPFNGVNTGAGSERAAGLESTNVRANTVALQARYDFSPKFQLAGWAGYTNATSDTPGNAEIINYAVQLIFPDLFREGNLAALTFGQQPTVVRSGGGITADRATGFHIEASYRFQVNKYISITPGVIYLTRPDQNPANPGAVVGVLRTSFVF